MGAPEFVDEHRVEVLVLGSNLALDSSESTTEGVDVRTVVKELKKVRHGYYSVQVDDILYDCMHRCIHTRKSRTRSIGLKISSSR